MGQSEAMKSVQLGSDFVVKNFNVFMIRQMTCIEMEFLEEGSLQDLIDNNIEIPIPTISKMLYQCSEVLSRMRQLNMVHNDIKPDNIMIQNKQFDIAVGDFGLSLNDQLLISETTKGGTKGYIAPEVLNGSEEPSFFSDLYSLGVTFEEVLECTNYNPDFNVIIKQLQSEAPRERQKAFYKFNSEWILQTKTMNHVWENDIDLISTILEKFEFKNLPHHISSLTELEDRIGFRLNFGEDLKKNADFIINFKLLYITHPSFRSDKKIALKVIKNMRNNDWEIYNNKSFLLETDETDRDILLEIYNNRGNNYGNLEEYSKAIEYFTKSIELNPSDADIYLARGISFFVLEEYSQSIEDFTKSIELNSSNDIAYLFKRILYSE